MSNSISRIALMTLFFISLPGCAIGVKSTSLEDIHAQQADTQLLTSVGFVLDDEAYTMQNKHFMERERESWISALSSFTDRNNIFIMSKGMPIGILKSPPDPNQILSGQLPMPTDQADSTPSDEPEQSINIFPEFAKTHAIVHVHINPVSEKEGQTGNDVLSKAPLMISFLTFWVTPAHVTMAYRASFSLSMPEEWRIPPAQWDYSYDRKEYYWLPLLPVAESTIAVDGKIETDISWQIEEKRRLVLKFLEDAKSLLQQH